MVRYGVAKRKSLQILGIFAIAISLKMELLPSSDNLAPRVEHVFVKPTSSSSCANCLEIKDLLIITKKLLTAEYLKTSSLNFEIEELKSSLKESREKTNFYRHKLWRAERRILEGKRKIAEVSRKGKLDHDHKESAIAKLEDDVQRKKLKLIDAKKRAEKFDRNQRGIKPENPL